MPSRNYRYYAPANLDIRGASFRSGRDTNITNMSINQTQDPMTILMKHVALGALANSSDRYDPPRCHENTRVALLDSIDRWAHGLGDSRPILWLRGPLGTGKSAIAQTSAERWAARSEPPASFFLSRTAVHRNHKECIIPTLAYQLTLSIPELQPLIYRAVLRDKGLFKKDLRTQMMELIIRPISAVHPDAVKAVKVVLVDGLDECCQDLPGQNYEEQQHEILEAIAFAARQPGMPLRFLVASRPEREIMASFNRKPLVDLTHRIVLDDSHNPDADIRLYLHCKFEEIKEEHPYIESSWPAKSDISKLIEKSSGQFVYASVVVRQLEEPRQDPRETFRGIMGVQALRDPKASPFADLDALYLYVMRKVSAPSLPFVTSILYFLCLRDRIPSEVFHRWAYYSPASIEKYLFIPKGQIYIHLADLHSVLEIPSYINSQIAPIRFLHASFGEFLTDPSRSDSFFLDEGNAYLRYQSIRLKHCYTETLKGCSSSKPSSLIPGAPYTTQFITQLRQAMRHTPINRELAERLAAFLGTNEDEFLKHVNDLGLSGIHAKGSHGRTNLEFLHRNIGDADYARIYQYLKDCGLDPNKYGLKEPDRRYKDRYH